MDPNHCDNKDAEEKLSEQFVEFIDLTDEDLEEVDVLEFGDVHGGRGCGGCHEGCGGCHRGCGGCHRGCGGCHKRCYGIRMQRTFE